MPSSSDPRHDADPAPLTEAEAVVLAALDALGPGRWAARHIARQVTRSDRVTDYPPVYAVLMRLAFKQQRITCLGGGRYYALRDAE